MIVRPATLVTPRKGLSLLEVLIALAIFLFSLVAIARLVDFGVDTAIEMDLRSQANLLAQSRMAEVVAGVRPLSSQAESPDDDDPDWLWSLDAAADNIPGLYRVKVTVARNAPTGRVEVVLNQFVLDPAKRGSTDSSTLSTESTTSGTTGTTAGGSP